MNEEQKHIESCRSEDPLAQTMEACGNESALQAALQPLLVETMQGYEPVATTAPTSPIAELPGVLISIIRRVATKPLTILGDRPAKQSLLGSLVTTWNAIRQRLSGNPSAGIPDRTTEMSGHSLPTALALLSDRKITGADVEDGMSLVHLLGGAYSDVTELTDDNRGWTCSVNIIPRILSAFPNAKTLTIGCGEYNYGSMTGNVGDKTIKFPYMTKLVTTDNFGIDITAKRVEFSEVTSWNAGSIKFTHCPDEWYMPKVTEIINSSALFQYYTGDNITLMHFGPLTTALRLGWDRDILPNCKHIEFTSGVAANLNLGYWNPTNVLADQDNLQQFLLNFRDYIALRLADNGSGLTLTLSQAVYDTIKDESHLFVFDEGTMTIYAYLTNIKHWTVTK